MGKRKKESVRPRLYRRLLSVVLRLALLWVGVSVAAVVSFKVVDPPFTAVMLAEPGPLSALEHRWASRRLISKNAALAAIAAEDQRFLDHHGIDFAALQSAWRDYQRGEPLRGASTISQQVAKNLYLWNGRSFVRKLFEAWFAFWIELLWSKERILEVYLNIAEFGPGVFGVEAAAVTFFGHSAAELSVTEAAALTAVLPSPKRMRVSPPSTYVHNRTEQIEGQMTILEERGHYAGLAW